MERIISLEDMVQINENLFEIPQAVSPHMRVPARIYMNKEMFVDIKEDHSLIQLMNVASLPGIQKYAIAMPDIHQGYGFPIAGWQQRQLKKAGLFLLVVLGTILIVVCVCWLQI